MPGESKKESLWTKETKMALGILVVFIGLLVWVLIRHNDTVETSPFEDMVQTAEDDGFDFEDTVIDESEYIPVGSGAGPRAGASGPSAGHSTEYTPKVTVQWLIMELRRIVRAGRSMDGLRQSENLTLSRRCLDGMQKLQRESAAIMAKGGGLPLPAEPPTISTILSKIKVCISCGSEARAACDAAEIDLSMISSLAGK